MASISRLEVGQTLWQIRKVKCSHAMLSRKGVFPVVVKEIDKDGQFIVASCNNNPSRKYFAKEVARLRVNKPEWEPSPYGGFHW